MKVRLEGLWWVTCLLLAVVCAGSLGLQIVPAIPVQAHAANSAARNSDLSIHAPGYEGIVFTQLPAARVKDARSPAEGVAAASFGEGGQVVFLSRAAGKVRILTPDFASAADPAVSFDGKRILFAGKKTEADRWDIYEMNADGSGVRQITRDLGNCRSPMYQSALFYLNDSKPSYQITFVSDVAGERSESGSLPATNLYSARFDGTGVRRLTYGISSSYGPFQMQDGRILFSHVQGSSMEQGPEGRTDLFGIHLDGSDFGAFSGLQGRRIKHMACTTPKRMAVFVEGDQVPWDGAGNLATLSLRRNFHSYKQVTSPADGLFHSPSALPDGSILVSRRSAAGSDTHSIYYMDLLTGQRKLVFADPMFHNVQAVALVPRPEPDGHSSVVEDDQDWSKLYCLSAYQSDLKAEWMWPGTAKRVRVIEGMPGNSRNHGDAVPTATRDGLSGMVQKRLLGDVELDEDGSFHLTIPPNIPVQIQLIDADGMTLRASAWFWTKNKENRGCIGCHEDHELTPENVFPKALGHAAAQLTLAPERRRTVDFRRDVMPILATKCATAACHGGGVEPKLTGDVGANGLSAGQYVDPGRARTSRLVWSILGRNTSRPWDKIAAQPIKPMPPAGSQPLTEEEKRMIIEWIDLGAQFNPLPSHSVRQPVSLSGGQP